MFAIGAVALLATAAACGGTSGGGYGSSTMTTGSGSGSTQAGGLATVTTSLGTILTDKAGMTLYGFAADSKGQSNCDAQCAMYWPPVPAGSALPGDPSGATAKVGSITRADGTKQLTIDGWPMYTYVGDGGKGDTTGQGIDTSGGLWWVVGTNGQWITSSAPSPSSSAPTSGSPSSGYTHGGY
jgi:predicted lipoprotein with Yx(FWY)xxD motif